VDAGTGVDAVLRQAHELLVAGCRRRRQVKAEEEQDGTQPAGRQSLHDFPTRQTQLRRRRSRESYNGSRLAVAATFDGPVMADMDETGRLAAADLPDDSSKG